MQAETFKVEGQKSLFSYIDLDLERTKRIYKILGDLSEESLSNLKKGDLKNFSFSSDKMRPMLSYISDNKISLSKHVDNQEFEYHEEAELSSVAKTLKTNLNAIEAARKTLGQVPFNPVFFLSEELTDAYLDYQLPLAWEFETDLIVIQNLNNPLLLQLLLRRGQKRVFLLGGDLDTSFLSKEKHDALVYRVKDHDKIDDLMTAFPQKPPRRFSVLDCGEQPTNDETMEEIKDLLLKGRTRAWLRFNTINRGDAVKILDNLANIVQNRQTSDFHNKFEGETAIIVCPGPSLAKNKKLLKKLKGKALIICVLHALKALKAEGIVPDIVIHTDPQNLKNKFFEKNGVETSLWDHWIDKDDLQGVSYFVTSAAASPDNFDIPVKEVLWMSCGLRIGDFLPIGLFDYGRVGGSVSHSAFDLAVEMGCSNIVLVGQDLALSEDGGVYTKHAELDNKKARIASMGEKFKVKGFFGKEVWTNSSFSFFSHYYTFFAKQVKKSREVCLYNCTEGGAFIEGFEHLSLSEVIQKVVKAKDSDPKLPNLLAQIKRDKNQYHKDKEKIKRFVKDNIGLSREVSRLTKTALDLTNKGNLNDDDLVKFDKVQNKAIKKLTKNYFYTLGLQKEIYILKAGIAADGSIAGQLGFHQDFLKAARIFNAKFFSAFTNQLSLLKSAN